MSEKLNQNPKPEDFWLHEKSGHLYKILMLTNEHATKSDYPVQVVYQDIENNHIWSRPLTEWHRSFGHQALSWDDVLKHPIGRYLFDNFN
jgi:hypothetical protein